MPHRARWLSALLLALMFHGQSLAASLTPFLLPGIADSVIALADGSLLFNNTYGPTFSRLKANDYSPSPPVERCRKSPRLMNANCQRKDSNASAWCACA